MTAAQFKKKWHRYQGKETSGYAEHFNDLCRLLGHPTPVEADPSGNDFFCFQKGVIKDAELLGLDADDDARPKKGFADVWKKDGFGWEYKGKHKNLDEAYKQLQRYRESLLNPPLMVVCDFDRYIVRTNFNGTVQEKHEFTNDQIDRPEILALLRHVFFDPGFLKPQRTTAQVTEKVAGQMAEVARSLQNRESVELADARTRAEVNVAQKKNLRIARFLNRIIFCLFAEDTALLPKDLFTDLLKASLQDARHFAETTEALFRVMAKGGSFGKDKIRHFNGHLFEDSTVFELTEDEIKKLAEAAEADWQFIQPSIMGTLFQRALDESHRAQLGAHYTDEGEIKIIVEPVLMAPLRREWAALKSELVAADVRRLKLSGGKKNEPPYVGCYKKLETFLKKLRAIIVLDPACGSGNFLYVSLQMLLDLEKEVIAFAAQLGLRFEPEVSVQQLRAIEINSYAFELAQVSVQIGCLQWRRDNGFDNDRTPVLQNLDGFQNEDALLVPHFRSKAKTLKEAQAGEHAGDDALKFYTEREWPECDVLVGNPPFLGGKLIRRELGNSYVDALFENLGKRVPPEADLCCYWFEKARQQIERGQCKRAGLLATQGIRGGANREVLKRIKDTGDIFFAESDREWVLAGANVHVSMIGFDNGAEKLRVLNSKTVKEISPQLDAESKTHMATIIEANTGVSFMGITPAGPFDIPSEIAREWLNDPNPSGKPNSDVLRPYFNGNDLTKRAREAWTVDFGVDMPLEIAASYAKPFRHLEKKVKPIRGENRREAYAKSWWIYAESRPAMRESFSSRSRFLATCMVAKHRMFVWLDTVSLPANVVIAFGRSDDFFLGLLQSRFHEVWSLKQGTRLETRPRYTPTTCFETFPFPFADDLAEPPDNLEAELNAAKHYAHITLREEPVPYHTGSSRREEADSSSPGKGQSLVTSAATKEQHRATIAVAAQELNELRERWLNPPEWTAEKILEFPGSADGPWARYLDPSSIINPPSSIGLVRYPRFEPRDADCAAKLKERTLTKLYNERPAWLDLAHKKLDAAVAAAYGFPADLTDEAILEKLLALNLERAAAEARAAKVKKPKATREKRADEMV